MPRSRVIDLAFGAVISAASLIATLNAVADEQVESLPTVIVTAQKRAQDLQNVPIAITALSADELQRREIVSVEDVLTTVPTITVVPYVNSSNTLFFYMRGVGLSNPGSIATDGAVGVYQDGFYIARPQGLVVDLLDIDRVEVLRGPQGTLYGRNTIGGAVNFISRAPTGEWDARQTLEFGSRHDIRSLTVVDFPTVDQVAMKFSVVRRSIDGFIRNPGEPHDFAESDETGGRFQLLWTPGNGIRADFFLELNYLDSTPQYTVDTQFNGIPIFQGLPYVAPSVRPDSAYRSLDLPLSSSRVSNDGLTFTWTPDTHLTLKSLTGYREISTNELQNYNESFGLPDYETRNSIRDQQVSQEIQGTGTLTSVPLQYVAGVYLFHEHGANYGAATSLAPFSLPSEIDRAVSDSAAIYGQVTWTPSQVFDVSLGVRYTNDHKSGSRSETVAPAPAVIENTHVQYSEVTPGGTLSYHWSKDFDLYLRVQDGYKAGAPNYLAPAGRFDHPYGPEHLVSYELGLKSSWLNERLRMNLAVFDSKYRDKQETIQVAPFLFAYDAFNIGRETITGIELDAAAQVSERLRLSATYAFLDTRIDRLPAPADTIFDPAINPFSPYRVGEDVKGLFTAGDGYAPRNSYDVAADLSLAHIDADVLSAHLDYRWQGERYGAGSALPGWQFATAPAFGVLNGNLAVLVPLARGRTLRLSLWGRNLLNANEPLFLQGAGGSTVAIPGTPAGYTASTIASWAEPRTLGVSMQVQL